MERRSETARLDHQLLRTLQQCGDLRVGIAPGPHQCCSQSNVEIQFAPFALVALGQTTKEVEAPAQLCVGLPHGRFGD